MSCYCKEFIFVVKYRTLFKYTDIAFCVTERTVYISYKVKETIDIQLLNKRQFCRTFTIHLLISKLLTIRIRISKRKFESYVNMFYIIFLSLKNA